MVNRCIGYSGCGDQSVNETLGLQLNNLQDELNANSAFVSGAIQPLPGLRVGLSNDNNDVAQDIFSIFRDADEKTMSIRCDDFVGVTS